MIRSIIRWLLPDLIDENNNRDIEHRQNIRRIMTSPEWKHQCEVAANLVEHHSEDEYSPSSRSSVRRRRRSSSSRSGNSGSCGGFDD